MNSYVLVLSVLCLNAVYALKIAAIFPYSGKSHHYVIEPILNELVKNGNDLTVISRFPAKQTVKNRVDITFGSEDTTSSGDLIDLKAIADVSVFKKIYNEMLYFSSYVEKSCLELLSDDNVQKFLEPKHDFDVVLVEQFYSDCSMALAYRLKAPIIGFTADSFLPWHFDRFGVTNNPSFVPCRNLGYGTRPKLIETVTSFGVCTAINLAHYYTMLLPAQEIVRHYLGEDVPSLEEIARNITLVFTNTYFPLHGSFSFPTNVIEVGGLHITKSERKSPDIEKLLDEAQNGVFYFSFGSMAKMSTMPGSTLKEFQDAFSELPEMVLWKWENDTMPNQPKNVVIKKWLPQFEILKHKNVKAFITHGGMLSTTEAIHAGVPVVAIPLFGDQFHNAQAAKEKGLGVVLNLNQITKNSIIESLKTIMKPEFRNNVKRISDIWKDRPMSAVDTAIFWIEHVAKYGGSHLRPVSADLPLYKYLLLDVIGIIFGVILVFVTLTFLCCRLMSKVCRRSFKIKTQ